MSDPKMCDCNQGRLPCSCRPPTTEYVGSNAATKPVGLYKNLGAGEVVLMLVFFFMIGIAFGWRLHGGVCS